MLTYIFTFILSIIIHILNLLTFGTKGSLNLLALSNLVPLIVFGAGLLGSYVPGGGAQPKNKNHLIF